MESCFVGSWGPSPGLGEGGCLLRGHCLWRSLGETGCEGSCGSLPARDVPWPLSRRSCHMGRSGCRCRGATEKAGRGGTYLVAQKWLVHIWGSVQYLTLNKILMVLLNHE